MQTVLIAGTPTFVIYGAVLLFVLVVGMYLLTSFLNGYNEARGYTDDE